MSDRLLHPALRAAIGFGLVLLPFIAVPAIAASLHAGTTVRIGAQLAGAALAVVAYAFYVRRFERREPSELGPRGAAAETGVGIAIGVVLIAVVVATLVALGVAHVERSESPVIGATLASSLSAALFEETLFRGLLLRLVERWIGTIGALAVSSLFFGAAHMANPTWSWLGVVSIVIEAGLLLGVAFLVTRRLWMPIGIHVAWNFSEGGIFGLPVSGFAWPGWFTTRVDGPEWLTGGSFGPEASLVTVVYALAITAVLVVVARRRRRFVAREAPAPT